MRVRDLRDTIMSCTIGNGVFATDVPNLTLVRIEGPSEYMPIFCEPAVSFVVQGAREISFSGQTFVNHARNFTVVAIDLPVVTRVVEASVDNPYLCLELKLDFAILRELANGLPLKTGRSRKPQAGLRVATLPLSLRDALCRLVDLLCKPADIAVLAPLLQRELLYRLLSGECSSTIRQVLLPGSASSAASQAVSTMKRKFRGPPITAALEHNVRTSFHAVTGQSPYQFQTALRLMEARRLLLGLALDVEKVHRAVGYTSISDFLRDYATFFGRPPAEDLEWLRRQPPHSLDIFL